MHFLNFSHKTSVLMQKCWSHLRMKLQCFYYHLHVFHCRACLLLIKDNNVEIQQELDLISSLSILNEFGMNILPLQGNYVIFQAHISFEDESFSGLCMNNISLNVSCWEFTPSIHDIIWCDPCRVSLSGFDSSHIRFTRMSYKTKLTSIRHGLSRNIQNFTEHKLHAKKGKAVRRSRWYRT
jgi:hypothetical protein